MKNLLRLEELFLALFAFYLFTALGFPWWWYAALFLTPDLSMLGYLAGPVAGAWTYNLAHHKGLAIMLYLGGTLLQVPWLQIIGLVLLGHSSLDRVFGYGLKYTDSFQHTHLGRIGKPESA